MIHKKRSDRITLIKLSILMLTLMSAGCAAAILGGAAGVGTVSYLKGDLKSIEKAPLDQVWDATLETVDDLEYKTVEEKKDGLNAKVVARNSDDDKIEIDLEQQPNEVTEVKIRVGTFGDESESKLILDKIRERLG